MIEKPTHSEIVALIGEETFAVWKKLCATIENKYDMNIAWNNGGKAWKYECKYSKAVRRSAGYTQGKTPPAL